MKTLKIITLTVFLVLSFLSFKGNQPKTNINMLEHKGKACLISQNLEQNKTLVKYSSERNEVSDNTGILYSINLISYITINFTTKNIKFESQSEKGNWHTWDFTFSEIINLSDAIGFKLNSTIGAQLVWMNLDNVEIEMNNGISTKYYGLKEIDRKENVNKSTNLKTNNDFEYSTYWRQEAFKASKNYLTTLIPKQMPECKVNGLGVYQPSLVNYIGGSGYRIKLYCEFDCGKGYNNPSYFWIDAYYNGKDKWNMTLIDQKLVD